MNILILRLFPSDTFINSYNVQEIGLALSINKIKGYKCDILLYSSFKSGVEVYSKSGFDFKIYWFKGKKILRQSLFDDKSKIMEIVNKYDVIQINDYSQIEYIKIFKRFCDKCVIYEGAYFSNSLLFNIYYKLFDSLFMKKKYYKIPCIAKSKICKDTFLKKFRNVSVLGVGLDINRFSNYCYNSITNKRINKKLLYVGSIDERKNILFCLKVLMELIKIDSSYSLDLVGNNSGKYYKKCLKFIKKNNLSDNVYWIGKINNSELPKYYQRSSILMMPSRYEIFGMVALESLYFDLPVFETRHGGSDIILNKKDNGIVIDNMDYKKSAILIDRFLENVVYDGERRQYVIENYTWDALSNKFINIYKEVE